MGYKKKGFVSTNQNLIEQCKINIKETFGWIPKSVNKFMKIREYEEMIGDKYCNLRDVSDEGKAKRRGGGFAAGLNYSIFNSGLADFVYRYFFRENDKILDPFMGRATRPILANLNNLHYVGFDINKDVTDFVKSRMDIHKDKFTKNHLIFTSDGCVMKELEDKEEFFEGIFTCPPYWTTEQYSDIAGDLSNFKSYNNFLSRIELCFENCFRLLKTSNFNKNKFYLAIFVVGSIRNGKHGLIDMDVDFQQIARKVGFVLHDKLIHENIPSTLSVTMRRNYVKRITSKAHETILIFRKGG